MRVLHRVTPTVTLDIHHDRGPRTLTPIAERLAVDLSPPVYALGLSRDERSNRLCHRHRKHKVDIRYNTLHGRREYQYLLLLIDSKKSVDTLSLNCIQHLFNFL